jgi:hypothetical protein
MALADIANTSLLGPTNAVTDRGTGNLAGPYTSTFETAQLGNPTNGAVQFKSLEASAHASRLGSFNGRGTPGTGVVIDTLGNIPSELDFNAILK